MAYTVQYEPEKNRKYPAYSRKYRNITRPVLITLVIVLCLGVGLKTGWLIPGDPQVTADAFTNMVDMLAEGENMSEAVTAFCAEVLEHRNED